MNGSYTISYNLLGQRGAVYIVNFTDVKYKCNECIMSSSHVVKQHNDGCDIWHSMTDLPWLTLDINRWNKCVLYIVIFVYKIIEHCKLSLTISALLSYV